MNLEKWAPWNWFKKEEEEKSFHVPVRHSGEMSLPQTPMHSFHREFGRLFEAVQRDFEKMWQGHGMPVSQTGSGWFRPSLDIASDEKEYMVSVDIPGIDPEGLSLEVSGRNLIITGEKKHETEEKQRDYYRIERSYGAFRRMLDLPEDADSDSISSHYRDGVLTVTIPKTDITRAETKKIEIKRD